jgi:hypothetical protein
VRREGGRGREVDVGGVREAGTEVGAFVVPTTLDVVMPVTVECLVVKKVVVLKIVGLVLVLRAVVPAILRLVM